MPFQAKSKHVLLPVASKFEQVCMGWIMRLKDEPVIHNSSPRDTGADMCLSSINTDSLHIADTLPVCSIGSRQHGAWRSPFRYLQLDTGSGEKTREKESTTSDILGCQSRLNWRRIG